MKKRTTDLFALVGVAIVCGFVPSSRAAEQSFDLKLEKRNPVVGLQAYGKYSTTMTTVTAMDTDTGRQETNSAATTELIGRWKVVELRSGTETIEFEVESFLDEAINRRD